MKSLALFILLIFAITLLPSCESQKPFTYLQDFTDTSGKVTLTYPEHIIQKNDVLSIVVYSDATDGGATDAMYNLANTGGSTSPTTAGFLVDNDGYIQYPRVGKIKAEGLTKPQLSEEIRKKVTGPLQNPSVIVRLLNFKIIIMGEIGK